MPTWRKPSKPLVRALGSLAALTLTLAASFVGPLATRAEPLPSLAVPSILPSLPLPSLPLPSVPIPSTPLPSVSNLPSVSILPSLPIPSLPLPSLSNQPSSSPAGSAPSSPSTPGSSSLSAPSADSSSAGTESPSASGDVDASADANDLLTAAPPSGGAQPPAGEAGGGPFGGIGLPQLVGAGSAAFLVGLLALYLAAGAGWLAVVRRKLGGMGLRVTASRDERLGGRHPEA